MAINLKQYTGSTITPTDDALLYDFIMSEQSGIFEGCEVTHLGANQLQISDGRGLIRGRVFTVSQQTILANVSPSGSVKGRLIVKVDLGNGEAPIALVTQAASALPELTQQDINRDGTVFELPLATYDVTEVLISGLASVANKLTAPIDDKLKQSVANLEKGKYNATAKKSGTTIAITGPAGAETVVFVAPSNWAAGDKYTYNGTALTLTTLTGEPVEDAWKSGSPIQFFIQGNKAFFKAGGGGKLPSDLAPLCPNFRVERNGAKVKISADKIQLNSLTDMVSGGVWAWGKTRPTKPTGANLKQWSRAELITTGKSYDLVPDDPSLSPKQVRAPDIPVEPPKGTPVQLKDIPVSTTSSPAYTMLTDNGKQQKYVIVQNNVGAATPNVILYRGEILPDTIQFNKTPSGSYHPYENSELDAYCSGYVSKLDKNVQQHLVEAPVVLYDMQSKTTKTINRKAFTPSITNIFGLNPVDGDSQFEWAKTFSNLKIPVGNTAWSSTTSIGMGTRNIEAIGASGSHFSRGQTDTGAVLFLIAMNPDTWFLDNGDGTYIFVGDEPAPAEQPLEIEIDWPESDPLIARQWVYNQKGVYQTMILGGIASTEDKPPYSAVLAENTWEQIAQAAADGSAKDLWKIGDTKDIIVNGETLTVAIMDFYHDDLADGSGKAPITFGLKNLMKVTREMDSYSSNKDSFYGTEMCGWLNGNVFNGMASDLQSVIKTVKKKTSAGNSSSSILTNEMKLWLFSEIEVFGSLTYSYSGEGTLYSYFASTYVRIKKLSNGSGSVSHWWERSPRKNYNDSFCRVDESGKPVVYAPTRTSGVCFGFCI